MGLLVLLVAAGCSDDGPVAHTPRDQSDGGDLRCDLDRSLLANGAPPDGIPALTSPEMVPPRGSGTAYLRDDDRVLGLVLDGEARAYPHNILWWHEVINDEVAGRALTVTYCPLTGSGIAFDRASMELADRELGVSGLLFANNLVLFDRASGELYGPQMSVEGRCEGFRGLSPDLVPLVETTWGRWRELHPTTVVVSSSTGHDRNYRVYPYGSYDDPGNARLLFPMPMDQTRPPKERVVGIREGLDGGALYPGGELSRASDAGGRAVVNDEVGGVPVAVLWEEAGDGTGVVFRRTVGGRVLTFETTDGGFTSPGTGTVWDVTGRGRGGALDGVRLEPDPRAYVAFWFAWRAFQPDARVWRAGT